MNFWDLLITLAVLVVSLIIGAKAFANAFPMPDTDEESDESMPFL